MIFAKPAINKVIAEQIYEVKRALIDSAAKVDHAESQVASARATVTYHEARLATLQAQLTSLGEFEIQPGT